MVDLRAQYARITRRDRRRRGARRRERPLHRRRGLRRLRAGVRRLLRRGPRLRRRQRHRRPDRRASGLRHRPRRRGRDGGQHLHRHRRGHPPERRAARLRGRGPGDLHHGPGAPRGAPSRPRTKLDPAGPPLRPSRRHDVDRRDRRAATACRVLEDAAQAHGGRGGRTARRRPGPRRLLQLLPGQEPRSLRRRRDRGLERRRLHRPRARDREPRRAESATRTSSSGPTAASTRCRPRSCGSSCGTWTRGTRSGASASPPTTRPSPGSPASRRPAERGGRPLGLAPLHRPGGASATPSARTLERQGVATAVHYPRPIHLQPAMAASAGRPGDLPVSEQLSPRGAVAAALPGAAPGDRRARSRPQVQAVLGYSGSAERLTPRRRSWASAALRTSRWRVSATSLWR